MLELEKLETTGESVDLGEKRLEVVMGVSQWPLVSSSGHGCVPVVMGVFQLPWVSTSGHWCVPVDMDVS